MSVIDRARERRKKLLSGPDARGEKAKRRRERTRNSSRGARR